MDGGKKINSFKEYYGKKVFIITKSGRSYQGTVLETQEICFNSMLTIIDKRDRRVSFSEQEIALIQEEK